MIDGNYMKLQHSFIKYVPAILDEYELFSDLVKWWSNWWIEQICWTRCPVKFRVLGEHWCYHSYFRLVSMKTWVECITSIHACFHYWCCCDYLDRKILNELSSPVAVSKIEEESNSSQSQDGDSGEGASNISGVQYQQGTTDAALYP